ncbi:MAG: hypothetical protein FWF28_02010, partial [Micrococcales bacterium]|nr:hypothetical protein [Micrococcales bacterium]
MSLAWLSSPGEVLAVSALFAVALYAVGLAVRVVLAPFVDLGRSVGLTIGLGIVATTLITTAVWRVHLRVWPAPVATVVLAIVILTVGAINGKRKNPKLIT